MRNVPLTPWEQEAITETIHDLRGEDLESILAVTLPDDLVRVDCEECGGLGHYTIQHLGRESEHHDCDYCSGSGWRLGTIKDCSGSCERGRLPVCSGTGWATGEHVDCQECHGTGHELTIINAASEGGRKS